LKPLQPEHPIGGNVKLRLLRADRFIEKRSRTHEQMVQCRAQRAAARAVVTPLTADRFEARFGCGPAGSPGPISPGQPAVCYADDRLLGGGWIEGGG